jgi:cell division initiation protein
MIDLTPLDVRKKRNDFRKGMRGYDTQEVDDFLEMVAERLEALVRENLQLKDRSQSLEQQVASQTEREEAVRDALVTAQGLRTEIREQAQREADKVVEDARTEARRMVAEAEAEVRMRLRNAERQADQAVHTLGELERRRLRFLRSFRQMLEREMDVVEVEESRTPLEERSFELELGALRAGARMGLDDDGGGADSDAEELPVDPSALAPDDYPSSEDETSPIDQLPLDAPRRVEDLLLYLDEDKDEDKDRD